MSQARVHLANGLHWVRHEVDASLTHARACLERYFDAPEDRAPLYQMLEELRLVQGVMTMVRCTGAATLAAEMVVLLEATLGQRVADTDDALSALSGATLQLADYVDLLVHGEDDRAIVLQAVLNELRLARSQPVLTEADLYAIQARSLAPLAAPSSSGTSGAGAGQDVARHELAAFQAAFLQWFKGFSVEEPMLRMRDVADRLAVNVRDPELVRIWSGISVLAECLAGDSVPDSLDLKRLFGRAGTVLRLLAEKGEAAAAASADFGWQLLYHVARTPRQTARARELLIEQGVAALLPPKEKIDELRQRLRAPNSGILERVTEELQRDFSRIKDGIDLAVRTGGHAPAELARTRERLERLSVTLGALGLPAPQQALVNQMRALETAEPEAHQWMELATALLRIEHSLGETLFRALGRHDGVGIRGFADIVRETPHAQDLRASREAVLREALVDFAQLKAGFDDYARSGDHHLLVEGPLLLRRIAGALRVIGEPEGADLLRQLESFAGSSALGAMPAAEHPRYADVVACAEIYVEGLRDRLPRPDRLLEHLIRLLDRLPTALEPASQAVAAPQPLVVAEPLPEMAEPAPASAPVPEGIDPEIRDVFVEEAGEVLAELRKLLPQLQRAPDDRGLLGTVRRGFHTLKGSGRMVGALRIGEFAWAVERLLNRCLEGALQMRRPVLDVVSGAVGLLPGLLDTFIDETSGQAPAGTAEAPAVAALIARAEAVAAGETVGETDMLSVFMEDARERLAFVGRWLDSRQQEDADFAVDPELVRAFHTLKGSAAVVNGGKVSQLAALFEHHLNALRFAGAQLTGDTLAVFADGLATMRDGIERIGQGQAEEADAAVLAGWRERLDASLHGATAEAPKAPPVDETFAMAALDRLQELEQAARGWAEAAEPGRRAGELVDVLAALATRAQAVGATALATTLEALAARLRPWIAGAVRAPEAAGIVVVLDVLELFFQQLDTYREGTPGPTVEAVLARIRAVPEPPPVETPAAEVDPELLDIFRGEAEELLEALDHHHRLLMRETRRGPVLADMRRTLHTLKGSARTTGAMAMGDVAHHLETALGAAGDDADPALLARLAAGLDGLHGLLDSLVRGEAARAQPVLEAIARAVPAVPVAPAEPSRPAAADLAPVDTAAVVPEALETFDIAAADAAAPALPDAAPLGAEPEATVAPSAEAVAEAHEPPPSDGGLIELADFDAAVAPAAEAEPFPTAPSTLTIVLDAPSTPAFELDASALHVVDAPEDATPEAVIVGSLAEESVPPPPVSADTMMVDAAMPDLRAEDAPAAAEAAAHDALPDPAIPAVDPSREVYWATGQEPAATLDPAMDTVPEAPIEPVAEHILLTSADLPPEATYAEPAGAAIEPVAAPIESAAIVHEEFEAPPLSAPEQAGMAGGGTDWTPRHGYAQEAVVAAEAPADFDVELGDIFSAEAGELLESLDLSLERWRNGESGEPVAEILRALHTLKGGARMAGLETMGTVAHDFESRVSAVVASDEFPDPETFNRLRGDLETLHGMHDRLRRGEGAALAAPETVAAASPTPAAVPAQWDPALFWKPEADAGGLAAARRETARVPVDVLDGLLNEAGEISIYRSRLDEHNLSLRAQLTEMTATIVRVRDQLRMMETATEAQIAARGLTATGERGDDRYGQDFDPLEMDRYSRMQELSRTIAESVNDLSSLHATMDEVVGESETLLLQQSRINTQVQQGLMGTLMVPFSRQLQRLSRVVRQTAQEYGKQVEIQFEGAEAELDRNVLERMTAPLEHLLRNAVVHGIETPAARQSARKPETGQIHVQLRREGAQLLVEVADDGAGLDFGRIRDKAVERGLMPADAEISDDDLSRFIFEAGFSTATTLTQDAGRGIGMDVVSSEVKQLGGTLELRSQRGLGTRFLVRLPLTLAVSQALLVGLGDERYAVPLVSVEGIARIARREVADYLRPDGALYAYGGRGYRVGYLGEYVGMAAEPPAGDSRALTAILVRLGEGVSATAERRVALLVDELIGNREVVSKPAGPQLSTVPGVAGATILADGRVVLILDVPALIAERTRRLLLADAIGRAEPVTAAVDVRETVMVVDDSVTMRRVAERLLTRNGYRVITARDGLDAMAMLQTETPSTILLDIEMPRADGFEVAAFIRNTPRLAAVPIIMITSRSGEKHRERARALHVDRYLIKPYQEEQLLGEIVSVRRGRSA